MIFKSYSLEQSLNIINNCKLFLFYGENQGLKKEFKELIKIQNKNCEILNLFQDEVVKNKHILFNEIRNKSLFDKKKIIFIDQVSEKSLDLITEIIEDMQDEKIFLFSDILDKKSKLRSYLEKSKICGIAACYHDNEISIRKIIADKLKGFQGLTGQVINLIIQNTNLDRIKVNNEINKIISYFNDKKIDSSKIDLLLNVGTNDDFNLLKDEALNGNKTRTNRLLADTIFQPETNIYYINAISQRIDKLNEINKLKNKTTNIETLISKLKPPVFWKDKPILIQQAQKWDKHKIKEAIKKTYYAELEIKSNSSVKKDLIVKNLIVDLCSTANAS